MKEYIERSAILDTLADPFRKASDETEVEILKCWDRIKKIPAADVVEVVRCAECKYAEFEREDAEDGIQLCWYCHYNGCWFRANDFCSYGERKMDGGVNGGKAD